jgi:hypothetical protein
MATTIGQLKSFVETLKNSSVFSSNQTGTDTAQNSVLMAFKPNATTPVPVKRGDSP